MDIRWRMWNLGDTMPAIGVIITVIFMIFLFFSIDKIEKLFPIRRQSDISCHEAIVFVSIGMMSFYARHFCSDNFIHILENGLIFPIQRLI